MITKEKLLDLVSQAYETSKAHGWHDEEHSMEHYMMLVLSEVGEALEADRRDKRARWQAFVYSDGEHDSRFVTHFEEFIKDTLEDELADVVIRLFDLCGTYKINVRRILETTCMEDDFKALCEEKTLCERLFILSAILCHVDGQSTKDDGTTYCLPKVVGAALHFIYYLCQDMQINIERHVELKMRYNKTREYKHGGKKY